MIPGLSLLALGGLLLWRGFTGRSPTDEISALLNGEPIFVRDESNSIPIRFSGGGDRTRSPQPVEPPAAPGGSGGSQDKPV